MHLDKNSKLKIMEELKLHSFGQNDHLEYLKRNYNSLRKIINNDKNLTNSEKLLELETLTKSFEKEKRNSNNNLY
jgi:Leucine-rich repeat (LRR) protein